MKPSPKRDAGIERIESLLAPGRYYTVREVSGLIEVSPDMAREYLESMYKAGMARSSKRIVRGQEVTEYCLVGDEEEAEIERAPTVVWVHRDYLVAAIHGSANIRATAE